LAGHAKEAAEKCRVAMRNSRRDGIKQIEQAGKEENWPEDAIKQGEQQVTDLLKDYEQRVDGALKTKTEDLLSM
jgi:ribosome recycling factor